MIITCHHCNHSWEYKGSSKYATCPKCHYKVMVSKVSNNISNNVSESKLKVSEKVSSSKLNVSNNVSDLKDRISILEEQIREIQNSLNHINPEIHIRKPRGILIKCSKCGYEWYFTGLKKIARCPECNARVNVNESIIQEE